MSGNCDTGIRVSDSAPASVSRIAMTTASRGRSIKTPEIMLRLSRTLIRRPRTGRPRIGWTRADHDARPHPLDPVGHDLFAFLQPTGDHRDRRRRLPQLDPPLLHLVVGP